MSDYSYIQVALRGEVQGATRTIYSYPAAGGTVDPGWNTNLVEPGAAMKRFLNASECYVVQSTPTGHYISLITRDTIHPDRGYAMISLLIDNSCSLTGRQVMAVFNNLKKSLIEEERHTDEAIDEALLSAGVPKEPVRIESWTYRPREEEPVADAAYRTYISVQELEAIFSFPDQPDYAAYRCILVVSATTSLRPGAKMPRITAQIRKQYNVICHDGVTASSTLVYDGDRITLTYSKEGFKPYTESVVAGTPSAYTKYDGSSILIRTAAQTGIRFVRRIPVRVISRKGEPLKGYTISVNGRSISTMDPYIDFTEKDLTPGEDVDIQVASNNYLPLKLKRKSEDVLSLDRLDLEMQPLEQGVTLRLDFGDGRVFEQQITIEKNTPEYNRLHSGNFHGFRAMRQVTEDNSEVYNVDVRITSRPVAPNFETAEPQADKPATAPKFENISDDTDEDKPVVDHTLPVSDPEISPDEEDEEERHADRTGRRRTIGIAVFLAAVVLAIVAWIWFVPQGDNGPAETDPILSENTDTATVKGAAPVAPMTPEEQAYADYLNSSAAWQLDKLKSPMGLSLAKAITEGDLNAFASNDYFAVTGRCSNAQAIEAVEMAWKAIGSPNESGNARRMRNSVKQGSVNLRELVNSMAKVRPSEKENSAPRPKK